MTAIRLPRFSLLLAAALGASLLLLAACGGSSDDGADTPTTPRAATTPAANASAADPGDPAEDECTAGAPPTLQSTSHEVGVATTKQTITMAWDAPATPVTSYRYAFSQNPLEPPEQMETLEDSITTANSGPLGQNRWYFYYIEVRSGGEGDLIRCGPYVITRGGTDSGAAPSGGSADTVTLTISVEGGSSVEYFDRQNERLFCGDTTLSHHDVTCTAEFVRGSEARIQRTLGLSDEEEARWRLAGWAGACEGIDADIEPRGGQCTITMDEDKSAAVSFARRAMITVTHTGPPQLLNRWGIDYRPAAQKGGGNPLTLRGTFDCDTDTLAACTKTAYFDTGTTVILTAGTGVDAGSFQGFTGACTTTESTCEFDLESDAEVTYVWIY